MVRTSDRSSLNRYRVLLLCIAAATFVLFAPTSVVSAQTEEGEVPGGGEVVRLGRASWDTGWFQAEILAALLDALGYVVEGPTTLENDEFYADISSGSVDVWANGWFPLHEPLLQPGSTPVGFEVRGGALQGYLVDRVTAERLDIATLADLADPDVAGVFDRDDDGVADLVGCNAAWACRPIVDHHLRSYGLNETVEQISSDYGPLMLDVVDRFEQGEPVLFYTFTPNWTIAKLVPGQDVVWLPVPFPSMPAALADQEEFTVVDGVPGCLADPCDLGFGPNDIRSVANSEFLASHPAIESLLNTFEVPLDDISEQNAAMIAGEDSALQIEGHAADWIAANQGTIDRWLAAATRAHLDSGMELSPRPVRSGVTSQLEISTMRVVTRIEPPFVTYDNNSYGGFSIEVAELLADQLGADLEVYGVNSSAKLLDDVARGSAHVGIGAVAITSQREPLVDFSQPYYESGLQILVADDTGGLFGGRVGSVLGALFSRDLLLLILILIVVLIIAAHIVWLAERGNNDDFPMSYRAGIWEALWWAAVTATTVGYGDKTPKGRTGRLFGLVWMFSGLFVLAYFTAGIATAFTIDELANQVESTADLRGRNVAVTSDSDAAAYLARQGLAATPYATSAEAFRALQAGEVDAIVHDAAVLQHFVASEPQPGADLASVVFAERGFGLTLPQGGELNELLNRALLEVIESEQFAQLHDTWFGAESSPE